MYKPKLDLLQTEKAIRDVKTKFQTKLTELGLVRLSAPIFVERKTGLNDNLNNVERPVSFKTKSGEDCEIVHSLAKWKRDALRYYGLEGIYTDMNAIRRDEDLSEIHSYYVDQWDWEMKVNKEDRTIDHLKNVVKSLYSKIYTLEDEINKLYGFNKKLPNDIFFITAQELENEYPNLTPKEREHAISKIHKAVFIIGIGHKLESGEKHDGRAPDYDDWELNGDIIVQCDVLGKSLELSSMGIRVSPESLKNQSKIAGAEDNLKLPFQQKILKGELPFSIGGGIGQSRLCLFMLEKKHIGEVQASVWPREYVKRVEEEEGVKFLYNFNN